MRRRWRIVSARKRGRRVILSWRSGLRRVCFGLNWDEKAGLLADTPEKKSFSQQANSLAVWLDVIPKEKQRAVMEKVLAASDECELRRRYGGGELLFSVLCGAGDGSCGDWEMSMWLSSSRGGRCLGLGVVDVGGDAGAYAVGLSCVERASYAGSAGDCWGIAPGAEGFHRVSDCSASRASCNM